jgi:hypothetical protein
VVFDGKPETLTDSAVIDLYGLEASDVLDLSSFPAQQAALSADVIQNAA